jgi:hypothetical protein
MCEVYEIDGDNVRGLDPQLHLRNHSPTGFDWGYGGSGPAQLSLGILCAVLKDCDAALQLYQRFKWDVVSKLPKGFWMLGSDQVETWVITQIGQCKTPAIADGSIDIGGDEP